MQVTIKRFPADVMLVPVYATSYWIKNAHLKCQPRYKFNEDTVFITFDDMPDTEGSYFLFYLTSLLYK